MPCLIPFCYFKTSPEIVRLAVMLDIHFQLSLRNDEDLPQGRGIETSHESGVVLVSVCGLMLSKKVSAPRGGPVRQTSPDCRRRVLRAPHCA